MSYEQAAESIYASAWTLRRMENADVGLKLNYVKSLLMTYGITDVHMTWPLIPRRSTGCARRRPRRQDSDNPPRDR
jgi:hypothetical protein